MSRFAAFCVFIAVLLSMSACSNDRLVFASTESLGVKLAVNTADTNPLTINLGYNSYNATLIPTTFADGQKALLANNGLCVVDDAKELARCLEAAHVQDAEALADKIQGELKAEGKDLSLSGVQIVVPVEKNKSNNMTDTLTTFSSFDTSVFASSGSAHSGGITLGRVFATGVGAQFVSQGAAKLEEARGRAECVKNLALAAGAFDTAKDSKDISGTTPSNASNTSAPNKVDPAVALALCGPWMVQVQSTGIAPPSTSEPTPDAPDE